MTQEIVTVSATAILRKEHEAILRMLDAVEEVACWFERGQPVGEQTVAGLVEFFRLFADRCHHAKEEELLFPLLEGKGVPRAGGCLGVMLDEHEQGRALVSQMADAATAYRSGQGSAGLRWAQAARGYVALLRQHIRKEDNVLFILAENLLTDNEQSALAEAFEQVEEEKVGAGTHERLHVLMEKLAAEILNRSRD